MSSLCYSEILHEVIYFYIHTIIFDSHLSLVNPSLGTAVVYLFMAGVIIEYIQTSKDAKLALERAYASSFDHLPLRWKGGNEIYVARLSVSVVEY